MTQTPSFSIGEHGFAFLNQEETAPLPCIIAQRDRLWRELVIEDKAAMASQMELLSQLLAMRSINTILSQLEGKPNSDFNKAIFSFMTQFQLSIFQSIHHQCKGDKDLRKIIFLHFGASIVSAMQAGMNAFNLQEKAGEL